MYIKGEINVERMKSVQGATATNASLRQINNDHVKFENAFSYNIQHIYACIVFILCFGRKNINNLPSFHSQQTTFLILSKTHYVHVAFSIFFLSFVFFTSIISNFINSYVEN